MPRKSPIPRFLKGSLAGLALEQARRDLPSLYRAATKEEVEWLDGLVQSALMLPTFRAKPKDPSDDILPKLTSGLEADVVASDRAIRNSRAFQAAPAAEQEFVLQLIATALGNGSS